MTHTFNNNTISTDIPDDDWTGVTFIGGDKPQFNPADGLHGLSGQVTAVAFHLALRAPPKTVTFELAANFIWDQGANITLGGPYDDHQNGRYISLWYTNGESSQSEHLTQSTAATSTHVSQDQI